MRRRSTIRLAAAAYAAIDVAVLMAPSVVLAVEARKGGLSGSHGVDLVLASAAVGAVHAGIAFSRLIDESRAAARRLDVWIAALDALVVLALGATLLLVIVLGGFADQHDVLISQGWSVVWLWIGVLGGAVVLAELSGRFLFRWLERAAVLEPHNPSGISSSEDEAGLRYGASSSSPPSRSANSSSTVSREPSAGS